MTQDQGNGGRARLVGITLLLLAFAVGGMAGFASFRVVEAREASAAPERDECKRGPKDQELYNQLDLSAEQRAQIEEILQRRHKRMRAIWAEQRPRVRAVSDSTREELRAILTPEQQAREAEFWESIRKRDDRKSEGKGQGDHR